MAPEFCDDQAVRQQVRIGRGHAQGLKNGCSELGELFRLNGVWHLNLLEMPNN
jgi:hypothetical protein